MKEIPTSTTGSHFSRISTADKGTGQSRISSAGQESKGTLAGLVLQTKEQNNEVGDMKIPKLYFSRKNNATQELEPEKRIPAGQQKNPDIN